MPRAYTVLAPALAANALLDVSVPVAAQAPSEATIVRHYDLKPDAEQSPLGQIKRIAVGRGDADAQIVALADDTHRISLTSLPTPIPEEPEDDARELQIHAQFRVKPARKSDRWIGLEVLPTGVLSSLSSGQLTLHPFSSSGTTYTASVPSPLACLRTIPSTSSTGPSQMALAGKDVELSVWDIERTFAAGAKPKDDGSDGKSKKRKKGELEQGEIWRAKHLPNNNLSLQTPINYLSLCILPTSGSTLIAAGTKSGHVRKYDTRQRKYVADWKVAREGGVVTLEAGMHDNELFFVDASSHFGVLDTRTGRTLYTYSKQTATAYSVLPLPSTAGGGSTSGQQRVGMLSLSSDATVRLHTVTPPPKEAKGNVVKGEIVGMVGGVGIGTMAFSGFTDLPHPDNEEEEADGEDGTSEDDEDGENVWDDLKVVRGDSDDDDDQGEDSFSESSSEDEAEALKLKRKKTDGTSKPPLAKPKRSRK
ncbi:hypothetical protein QFC19_008050 [Naganishia cerealis]|uniref:Uncharacterized protein n=1 Tax=Naganishia cerealis TaxID=610337 RepID=A0ACC2V506_9TREE|nr:hypothetical protein QFC19_008050 [Naganishia cerealis]